jgi:transcriptional regulator with XRE-family HTH domain
MDDAERAAAARYGRRIRIARTAHDLTPVQLAQKVFVYRQSIDAWESGAARIPPQYLARIAHVLDIPVVELACPDGESPWDKS